MSIVNVSYEWARPEEWRRVDWFPPIPPEGWPIPAAGDSIVYPGPEGEAPAQVTVLHVSWEYCNTAPRVLLTLS